MNRKVFIKVGIVLAVTVTVLLAYQNCANKTQLSGSLGGVNVTSTSNGGSNIKYIFVFDHSLTNGQNYIPDGNTPVVVGQPYTGAFVKDPLGGLDPEGSKRFTTVTNALSLLKDTSTRYLASVNFRSIILNLVPWVDSTGTKTTIATLDKALAAFPDGNAAFSGGGADFLLLLPDLLTLVQTDIAGTQSLDSTGTSWLPSTYAIIIFSGSPPCQTTGNLATYCTNFEAESDVIKAIQQITALQAQSPKYVSAINISTAYYHLDHSGNPPTGATTAEWQAAQMWDNQIQQWMIDFAKAGNGQFIDLSSNTLNLQ